MGNGTRASLTGGWYGYLRGLATLVLPGDASPHAGASPGEAVLTEAETWARQGPWASGLFTREPTRVLVLTGWGGADSDLSRAIALRLASGFLQGQPDVPLPLRITMRGHQDGEGAWSLLSRHLRQAGLAVADWRFLNAPALVTIDGLDDLLPGGRPLPAREELELLSSLCSYELAHSRIILVTGRQPDDTRLWQLIMDRLDENSLITVLDAASARRPGASAHAGSRSLGYGSRLGSQPAADFPVANPLSGGIPGNGAAVRGRDRSAADARSVPQPPSPRR